MSDVDFQLIGTGINVYEHDTPAEGKARWLDSPSAVMELVMSGDIGVDDRDLARRHDHVHGAGALRAASPG